MPCPEKKGRCGIYDKMQTEYVVMTEDSIDKDAILRAGRILKEGGLVAFPTETVYGLGGDALNPSSSEKIYAAKGRPSDNPLIVHVCDADAIPPIIGGELSGCAGEWRKLADAFWPGPLTMIFPKSTKVPYATTGGLDTVAIRFPSNKIAAALIGAAGGYVAAPSANRSGRPSPTSAKYCREDLDGRVDMIIDGGPVGIGLESTIIDLTGDEPIILRPGYVTRDMLREVLGRVEVDRAIISDDSSVKPKAPGMKYRHYAPKGDLTVVNWRGPLTVQYIRKKLEEAALSGRRTGVICTDETAGEYRADLVRSAGARGDYEENARRLFDILRSFDDEGIEVIWSESFSEEGLGEALMNRLKKAAGQKVVEPTL